MAASQTTKHIFVTGRRRLLPRQGPHGVQPRTPAARPRAAGHDAEARPLSQRRPGHDEPVPARRGVRHRRRRGDRPRHRALRAVPRRRPARLGQRDHRPGLLGGDRQGTARRVPRRHRAGDPAHHQRDQGADPRDGRLDGRRHRHHRDRRHRRRHRVAAVPRGRAPGPPRRRPRQRLLPARLAGALHRAVRRAEDQAHPALRRGAALHRHPARRDRAAAPTARSRRASSARSR